MTNLLILLSVLCVELVSFYHIDRYLQKENCLGIPKFEDYLISFCFGANSPLKLYPTDIESEELDIFSS